MTKLYHGTSPSNRHWQVRQKELLKFLVKGVASGQSNSPAMLLKRLY
jgi:hypothetical protein